MKYLNINKVKQLDNEAIEKLSVETLMENAGKKLADFIKRFNPKKVLILYGQGNNGGDGLVAARYLANDGIEVSIISGFNNKFNKNVKKQLNKLESLPINNKFIDADIIADCLLGYNQKGNPRGKYKEIINEVNKNKRDSKVISLDIPTGLDPETGKRNNPCIDYDYILTLGVLKKGLKNKNNVYLVDIGFPRKIYKKYDLVKPEGIIKIS